MYEHRQKRIEKRILQLLVDLYYREFENPNIGFTTFTKCYLSGDSSNLKIFVSIYESPEFQIETLKNLNKLIPFIRNKIAKNIRMKYIPRICFKLDKSLEKTEKLESLLSPSS